MARTPTPTPSSTSRRRQPSSRARRRRKKQRLDKGWFGGAFVAVMTLWSGLWKMIFGNEDGSREYVKLKKIAAEPLNGRRVGEEASTDSEAVDTGAEASDGEIWQSPVTRAPENLEDQLEGVSDVPPPRARGGGPSPHFTLQLRSCLNDARASTSADATTSSVRGTSILTNPSQPLPIIQTPQPQTKLLPNPLSTALLTSHTKKPSLESDFSSESITITPRTATPTIIRSPANFHRPKTLILDLDETLIHSTSRPMNVQSHGMGGGGGLVGISLAGLFPGSTRRGGGGGRGEGHTVEVVLGGRSTLYHVYKRPFVDHFLKKVSSWYTLVVFTASMQEYADPVIDWLDGGRGLFGKKLYRESCSLQPNGSYIKDLSVVEEDLSRVCFVDNSPVSYNWNKANALPIEGWTSDPNDEALLDLLPVLDSLRFTNDVRRVLGIRGF